MSEKFRKDRSLTRFGFCPQSTGQKNGKSPRTCTILPKDKEEIGITTVGMALKKENPSKVIQTESNNLTRQYNAKTRFYNNNNSVTVNKLLDNTIVNQNGRTPFNKKMSDHQSTTSTDSNNSLSFKGTSTKNVPRRKSSNSIGLPENSLKNQALAVSNHAVIKSRRSRSRDVYDDSKNSSRLKVKLRDQSSKSTERTLNSRDLSSRRSSNTFQLKDETGTNLPGKSSASKNKPSYISINKRNLSSGRDRFQRADIEDKDLRFDLSYLKETLLNLEDILNGKNSAYQRSESQETLEKENVSLREENVLLKKRVESLESQLNLKQHEIDKLNGEIANTSNDNANIRACIHRSFPSDEREAVKDTNCDLAHQDLNDNFPATTESLPLKTSIKPAAKRDQLTTAIDIPASAAIISPYLSYSSNVTANKNLTGELKHRTSQLPMKSSNRNVSSVLQNYSPIVNANNTNNNNTLFIDSSCEKVATKQSAKHQMKSKLPSASGSAKYKSQPKN